MQLLRMPRYGTPWPIIERPPDDYASEGGRWHAAREKGRLHEGIDLVAIPGTLVVAPWDLKVIRRGRAYADLPMLSLVEVEPLATDDVKYKFLYVYPYPSVIGRDVSEGTPLGHVEDLSVRYPVQRGRASGICPHMHVEKWLLTNGTWNRVRPTEFEPQMAVPEMA